MTKRQATRVRLIRSNRSYTTRELADQLLVTPTTVLRWQKQGLEPIDREAHKFLFLGRTAKAFLRNTLRRQKHPLKPNEFYCPRCRCPRLPKPQSLRMEATGKKMGRHNELVLRRGTCIQCGSQMVRLATRSTGKGSQGTSPHANTEQIVWTLPSTCEC
jgi:hypothetical protein